MLTIDFPDKSITYDTFVHDVAVEVARQLSRQRNDPEMVSQRQAYAMFGRGNVDRWRRQGKIQPCKRLPHGGSEAASANPTRLFR